ncbi:hypothetical protein D9619_001342 [Psilocybe cf. subviscida]|uniref:Uncharacterized protein n=1 Tax=Psilocybe cf. subviscida TaxID=2480587 RepID=A0A8H5BG16_9AGAR|nr:hypothetical protein D9619_001342 [Psilocybe cf. subviscida]
MATDAAPVLSFPAILRNPGITGRFAHLHGTSGAGSPLKQQQSPPPPKKRHRDQNEGKRWVRRKDNSRFVGNPHIVPASRRDFAIPQPATRSTFPEPLPNYLQRSVKLPTAPTIPVTDPASANAGRFAHSLKGMRKDLRRAGGRAQVLVRDVEQELVEWLVQGGTVLAPDLSRQPTDLLQEMGIPVGNTGTIVEVSRTPLQLVWRIADDAFARYVVHCCARYHEVVSFSKGTGEERLTYLLRPNVTRPDRRAAAALETPPVTDIDYSSNPETDDAIDSDFVSDREMDESDVELAPRMGRLRLAAIDESPVPGAPLALPLVTEEEGWSHVEDSEFDDFESGSEFGSASVEFLQPRLHALHIHEETGPQHQIQPAQSDVGVQPTAIDDIVDEADRTITEIRTIDSPLRRRDWAGLRSPSSPSRSPARSRPSRRRGRQGAKKHHPATALADGRSFYDYLFL